MTSASRAPLLAPIARFARDYAQYAGAKGLRAAVLVLLGAFLEGIGLALIAPLLAVLFDGNRTAGAVQHASVALFTWFGVSSLLARLSLLLGMFVVAMIVRAIVLLTRDVATAELRIGFVEIQRSRVADALAAASWSKVAGLRHARVLQVMSADIQQIGQAAYFLTDGITAATMLMAQCALALWLSPPLALLSFAILIASGLAMLPMMRRAQRLGTLLTRASQNLLHGTSQFLGGLKLAVSQNLQHEYLAEFHSTMAEQSAQQIGFVRQQTMSRLMIATVAAIVGAALVLAGLTVFHVAPAMLVALIVVVTRMSGPTAKIQQGAQMLANALPAYEAARALTRELEFGAPPPTGTTIALPADTTVRFEHVSFVHQQEGAGEPLGVHDLTLTIEPAICLGIKGASGAGKTTFADLLAGLYPPQSGAITVGGHLLAGVLGHWRGRIAYIAQDPFLFHGTIRRNLAWAAPSAGDAEMWRALELAEATSFVRNLPAGLDTVVGERGTLVSGGERQRIALARAILRRPQLLILDEATNALDPHTEALILGRLTTLAPKPTIVIIAHRPDCLVHCDRVLTMEDGRLA